MTKDMNRDIAEIEYNLLNLPTKIRYQNGSRASYIHAATGEKLRVDHGINVAPVLDPAAQTAQPASTRGGMPPVDSTPEDSTFGNYVDKTRVDYCGNMIYDRGVRRLLTDEGYVTFAWDGTPQYHYYLRDHLGNIRVVIAQDGTVEQKTHDYPFGGIMYDSTRELLPSEILSADSTDYLLGGSLTMKNGRIDKYLFDEGYCQATKYVRKPSQDNFTFYYYNRDHLGSNVVSGRDQGPVVVENGSSVISSRYGVTINGDFEVKSGAALEITAN